jgi:hypothetical protein
LASPAQTYPSLQFGWLAQLPGILLDWDRGQHFYWARQRQQLLANCSCVRVAGYHICNQKLHAWISFHTASPAWVHSVRFFGGLNPELRALQREYLHEQLSPTAVLLSR